MLYTYVQVRRVVVFSGLFFGFCLIAESAQIFHPLDTQEEIIRAPKSTRKNCTFIVYAAADNNLRDFAARNIKQMSAIGSNEHLNIVVHLDIKLIGNKKTTRRYFVGKNDVLHVNPNDTFGMDSGDPQTLISCCKWAIENYPAQNYVLIFWNHGTGIIDPMGRRLPNSNDLFNYNGVTCRYELDRTIGYLDLIENLNEDARGICWDDSTGNYLTNQKLDLALKTITRDYLNGNRFAIIGFDACLMSMIEISSLLKKYAHIQVSSQEVEPGPGWDYHNVLSVFSNSSVDMNALARNIVHAYEQTYQKLTNDYTLSALNLDLLDALESNINTVATLLIRAMEHNLYVKNAVHASKNKQTCTHFDEPTYKDLYHFYLNLKTHLKAVKGINKTTFSQIANALDEGAALIKEIVFANVTGPNIKNAHGISIYLPDHKIHPSYKKTEFSTKNAWGTLITNLLLA